MLHTDSYFAIGQKHIAGGKPCQDYAMSGEQEEGKVVYAALSDGCSTGRNTDIGARLIVLAVIQAIRGYWSEFRLIWPRMVDRINAHRATAIQNIDLGLAFEDLLATSIYAVFHETDGFVRGLVSVQGDGVVAVKYRDGSMSLMRFDWPNNMPFYPAYEGWRLNSFIVAHGGDVCANVITEEKWYMDKDGNFLNREVLTHCIQDGIDGIKKSFLVTNDIEYVAIFSDGVTQIDNVDWKQATRDFMGFKSSAGEFAKRRMIAGLKEVAKIGKGPLDDISYAVIHITNESKEGETP